MPNSHPSAGHAARRYILWSLVVLIVILPFNEGGNGHILQAATQLLLLLCTVVWGVQSIRAQQIRIKYTGLDFIVLASLAWIGVSLVFSEYRYATILEGIKILSISQFLQELENKD